MKYATVFVIYLLFSGLKAQTPPELPHTSDLETCFPDTTGYSVITVGPIGRDYTDLQQAINAADPATVIMLDAGAVFNGSFSLPNKSGNGWIIITGSRMDLLPAQHTRINPNAATGNVLFPTQRSAMPRILSTNLSGLPCFRTQAAAHHYRFVGLEISIDTTVTNSYGLMFLGDASSAQNTLAKVPQQLIVDRCYVHGHDNATIMKGGVLLNCGNAAVVDSYIAGFHSIGFDTYAMAGTNGPGPFKILNNYLEAAGENILFGGAAPAIPNLVPADIEIRNNHFFKPFSWRVGHPDYAGKHWTIKNLFELKTGVRVLLDGNILENAWADLPTGQSGYAILLTVRAEGGSAPQADVSDITITNNIISHAGAGISLSGHDDQATSQRSKRIRIANNLFNDIDGAAFGDGNIFGPNDGTFLKIGDPADVIVEHNTVLQSGPITWAYGVTNNIVFRNNIFHCFLSDGGYQGIYGPGFAHGGNGPMGMFFPDITDANQGFHKNVLIGGNATRYSNYNNLSQNYFPSAVTMVGFIDYPNGAGSYYNYALANSSTYKNAGTDLKDPGVDFIQLDNALNTQSFCTGLVKMETISAENPVNIYPNPTHERIWVMSQSDLKNVALVFYNVMGVEVKRKANLSGRLFDVPISDLPAGMYFVAIKENEKLLFWKPLMLDLN